MISLNLSGVSIDEFGLQHLVDVARQPSYNWIVKTTQLANAVRAGYDSTPAKNCIKISSSSVQGDYYKKHLAAAVTFMTGQLKVSGGFASLTSIQSIPDGYLFVFV